jgi:hypothetical protein
MLLGGTLFRLIHIEFRWNGFWLVALPILFLLFLVVQVCKLRIEAIDGTGK